MRRERERAAQKEADGGGDLPFGVYLLFSSFVAIAAVSRLPARGTLYCPERLAHQARARCSYGRPAGRYLHELWSGLLCHLACPRGLLHSPHG